MAPSRIHKVHKDETRQTYILRAGSIHGLSTGAKFDIYIGSDATSVPEAIPVYKAIADVTTFEVTLTPISEDTRFPADLNDARALLAEAGHISEPKLFIASYLHLLPIFDALVYLHTTSSPDEVKFALAGDRADACLEVKVENDGQLGFTILDDKITQHGLHHLACKITPDFDSAVRVLRAAAHYFHQLHLSQHNRNVKEHIDIQFFQLKLPANAFSHRTATGPNLMKDGIVSLEIGDGLEDDEQSTMGSRSSTTPVAICTRTSFCLIVAGLRYVRILLF